MKPTPFAIQTLHKKTDDSGDDEDHSSPLPLRNSVGWYIVSQFILASVYLLQMVAMAILAGNNPDVVSATSQNHLVYIPILDVSYTIVQANTPLKSAWVLFFMFAVLCLMHVTVILQLPIEAHDWNQKNYDTPFLRGERGATCVGYAMVFGALYAMAMQQTGVTDVLAQGLVGSLFGFSALVWYLSQRHRDDFAALGICVVMGFAGMGILAWTSTRTLSELGSSGGNDYSTALVVIAVLVWVGWIVCHFLDMCKYGPRSREKVLDFGIIYVYDFLLLVGVETFVWILWVQLDQAPPHLISSCCYPHFFICPFLSDPRIQAIFSTTPP